MSHDSHVVSVPNPRTPRERPATGGRSPWAQSPWLLGLAVLVVFNLLWALPRYMGLDPASSRIPLDPSAGHHFGVLVAHIFTGNVALVTVLLQLMPRIRRDHLQVHRASGLVYMFVGVFPSALLALAILPNSAAPTGQMGLFMMASLWMLTTAIGFRMQLQHRYTEHRRWMIYSFALAMGTTWGRLLAYLLQTIPGFKLNIMPILEFSNWLCWVVNLMIAWWWVDQRPRSRQARAARRRVTTDTSTEEAAR